MSVYVKICRAITGSKISFDVLNCSKEQIHILKNGERKKMSMKNIFEKVAEQHNTTTEEVYSEIQRAINAGFDNPDPAVQESWRKVKFKGERPTTEEVMEYLAKRLRAEKSYRQKNLFPKKGLHGKG